MIKIPTICTLRKWKKENGRLNKRAKVIREEHARLQKELSLIEYKKGWLNKIAFWHDGIPISTFGNYYETLIPDAQGNIRWANIYLNQHNKQTWGISISEYLYSDGRNGRSAHETWLGAGYASEQIVREIMLAFFVDGTLPQ